MGKPVADSWSSKGTVGQLLLRATRYDLLALIVRDDLSDDEMEELIEMADGISDTTGASIAIFPEGVLKDARNYSLRELIELRDQIDETIEFMAERTSVGEA